MARNKNKGWKRYFREQLTSLSYQNKKAFSTKHYELLELLLTTHFNLKDWQGELSWIQLQCQDLETKSDFHWWEFQQCVQQHCSHSPAVTHWSEGPHTHEQSDKLKGNWISTASANTEINLDCQYRAIFFLLCTLWIHKCLKSSNLNIWADQTDSPWV